MAGVKKGRFRKVAASDFPAPRPVPTGHLSGALSLDGLVVLRSVPSEAFVAFDWEIVDERGLAAVIARLVLGQFRYVERVLHGLDAKSALSVNRDLELKIEMLRQPKNTDHRDGWIFQLISWVFAYASGVPARALSPPHAQPTSKGFDSVALRVSSENKVVGTVITEDKATANARPTLTDQVWPEIRLLEAGDREGELQHAATALIERFADDDQGIEEAIEAVFWGAKSRSYRVCIGSHDFVDDDARSEAFLDFSVVAPGESWRRLSEVFRPADIRIWMEAFSAQVADELEAMMEHEDV